MSNVEHPAHYNKGKIEVIDFIEDQGMDFNEGNVVKYVSRWRDKGGTEDLRKAKFYLERLISQSEDKEFDKFPYAPIPLNSEYAHKLCGPCECGFDHCTQAKGGPDERT